MKWSSDEYLLERFGSERISGVEHNLKETRTGGQVDGMVKLRDFLGQYNTTDIYMVSGVPKNMMKEVEFLPCLQCGGYLSFLDTNNFWMGRGGSKSVVHYDDQDNINCMIAGEKRFVFMHPSYKEAFEAHPNTKKNRFGWVDTDLDRSIPGYGAFMGKIDVDKMDLVKCALEVSRLGGCPMELCRLTSRRLPLHPVPVVSSGYCAEGAFNQCPRVVLAACSLQRDKL